jgi:holo-[acyl-carrier protein] synthase
VGEHDRVVALTLTRLLSATHEASERRAHRREVVCASSHVGRRRGMARALGVRMDSGMALTSVVVGLDLVQISAIASSVARFGARFLERVYTVEELRYCMREPESAATHLAGRFAAKEAVRKVLLRADEPVAWRSIEIMREPGGACRLVLHREAHACAVLAGFTGFSLSMTHEADYASAVVLGERLHRGGREE